MATSQKRQRHPSRAVAPRRLLPRAERREQILAAATRAFARAGFTATSLADIAAEAAIDRVILYRHFASKADLYRAVLRRAGERLWQATGAPGFNPGSIANLLSAAAADPDGFRLMFHHAAREPEFRKDIDAIRREAVSMTRRALVGQIPDPAWARWASMLVPTVTIEAVIAWLDTGQPDRKTAAVRVGQAVYGVIQAAKSAPDRD